MPAMRDPDEIIRAIADLGIFIVKYGDVFPEQERGEFVMLYETLRWTAGDALQKFDELMAKVRLWVYEPATAAEQARLHRVK